jgi:hypothetical protein
MTGRNWTPAEEAQLLVELTNGVKLDEIAISHRRTRGAITSRQRHIAVNFYKDGISTSEICTRCRLTQRCVTNALQRRGLLNEPLRPPSPWEY